MNRYGVGRLFDALPSLLLVALAPAGELLGGLEGSPLLERFGERFVRIESINKVGNGHLRSLDLRDKKVRDAVREVDVTARASVAGLTVGKEMRW